MSRKRHRGHWCWCFGRVLPNERFSGRGHAAHLCRECARLPRDERLARQAILNIDRAFWRFGPSQARRSQIERFLHHADPRVRHHVGEVLQQIEYSHPKDEEHEPALVEAEESDRVVGPHTDGDIPF